MHPVSKRPVSLDSYKLALDQPKIKFFEITAPKVEEMTLKTQVVIDGCLKDERERNPFGSVE